MMKPSNTFTSIVLDAAAVDPKLLERPSLSSWEAFVTAVNEVLPDSPPCVDGTVPDLVPDDGSSQSSTPPPCSPQDYDYPSPPQPVFIDYGSRYSPIVSSSSPTLSATRAPTEAKCAGGRPIKQKDGYNCSRCGDHFKRRDDAKRHIDTAGMEGICRYCGKHSSSGRKDGRARHLRENKECRKVWDAGSKAGLFTERSVKDAYN